MQRWFKRPSLKRSANLILLLLAALLLALLRAPLAEALVQPSPAQPEQVLINQPPCATLSERGIIFDFLGYLPQADYTTLLAWRITNPSRNALDAVGFTTQGWTPVTPAEGTLYTGALGDYGVRWALHNLTPSHEAFFLQPQGEWFQAGAQETFVLTVHDFEPQRQLFVWVRTNQRLSQVHLKPIEHNCLLTPPAPSPTPTATTTPASPLPTPTPNPALALDDYSFSEPRVVLTNPVSAAVMEWLPDSRHALVSHGLTRTLQLLDTTTGQTVPYSTHTVAPGDPVVWLNTRFF